MKSLRPHERIRRRPEFLQAYEHGRKLHARFMTVFVRESATPVARLGVSATRKFGPAVVRNRAKRRGRELFRHYKPMSGVDLVIIPRRGFDTVVFTELESDYLAALRRLRIRVSGAQDARP